MPFPLAKLGYLLLRQLGKHVAIALKARTAKSPRFKSMCHGLANWYHSRNVNAKSNILGIGKVATVEKLNPDKAVQLGTELMGELFSYIIFCVLVVSEVKYSSRGNEIKEEQRKQEWLRMERKLEDITMTTEQQQVEINELRRLLHHLEDRNRSLTSKLFRKGKDG